MRKDRSIVWLASAKPGKMDRDCTLPARFQRLLGKLPLRERVKGLRVAIKMHVGSAMGYSTIHPFFVKLLVDHIREGQPRDVFITDGDVRHAAARGYAPETVGARLVPVCGEDERAVRRVRTGWAPLASVLVGRAMDEADVLVNFAHLKGHGDCGFGGACKNLAMGCIPPVSRRALHELEGDLAWNKALCVRCRKCIQECPTQANSFDDDGNYDVFWHDCKMCQHCMLICPTGAIKITNRRFALFQEGLARVAKRVLSLYESGRAFHVNVITHVTPFCDCWGMTTPALVPDVGIMAGEDIVAVERAALDAVKTRDLIPGSIPPPLRLGKGRHLFEKLHARDPYEQVRALERLGCGTSRYALTTVD